MKKLSLCLALIALLFVTGIGYALTPSEMNEKGWDAEQKSDYTEAVKWYHKAAELGDVKAQKSLGRMYENGQGVSQDYTEAVKWYRKAAEQGDADAQRNLGEMYMFGRGLTKDYSEAAKWYRKAAEQGDVDAQYNLGGMYFIGKDIPQNYSEAVKWFRKAAEQGHDYAQHNLAIMYDFGQGVTKDHYEATKWHRKAAEQGNAEAQSSLGYRYLIGLGVIQDYSEALKWYLMAAEQDDVEAQTTLGALYYLGQGVIQDYSEAAKWYRMAAEQGDAKAQYNVGYMYFNGFGVAQNYSEAAKWYRMAAEQGDSNTEPKKSERQKVMEGETVLQPDTGMNNGHEWVDLGLPSGLKWATCNIGATTSSDYGNYYAWGETTTKSVYVEKKCHTRGKKKSKLQAAGIIDSGGNLTKTYDAANANWGGTWRMPTEAEFHELIDHCTWIATTREGRNCYFVVGPNDNYIFLPITGWRCGNLHDAERIAVYWSSSCRDNKYGGSCLWLDKEFQYVSWEKRYFGLPIRPVSE